MNKNEQSTQQQNYYQKNREKCQANAREYYKFHYGFIGRHKSKKRWTEEENNFMKEHYENMYIKDIMKHLNRSQRSITCHAFRMGLKNKISPIITQETRALQSRNRIQQIAEGRIVMPHSKENDKKTSIRMKLNNPMENPKVVQKVLETKWKTNAFENSKKNNWLKTPKGREYARNKQLTNNTRVFVKKPSYPQVKLFNHYKKIHSDAVMEFPVKIGKKTYFLDIAVPSKKLDIEYDGKYWHLDKEKDRIRDENLTKLGWKVTRFDKIPYDIAHNSARSI